MSSTKLDLDTEVKEQEVTQTLSLDSSFDDEVIYLISKEAEKDESKKIAITKKQASNCKLFATTIENDPVTTDINVPEIKHSILTHVVNFLVHYNGEKIPMPEKPARSDDMKQNTTEWNADFIDAIATNKLDLYALISAANYIDCEGLLHLACCKVASMIKNIPLSEIKKVLKDDEKKEEN